MPVLVLHRCMGLSLVLVSGGCPSLWCGLLLTVVCRLLLTVCVGFSLLVAGSRGYSPVVVHGFSCCRARVLGVGLQQLHHTGSIVAAHRITCPLECGIFLHQGSNHVPCIGRWILKHWATREVIIYEFWWNKIQCIHQRSHLTSQ